jgi:YVTN family beta-propeller protein
MKRISLWIVGVLCAGIMLGLFIGCEKDESNPVIPPATSKALYVMNGLGASISAIDLNTDAVSNNLATLGKWPNQVVYYSGNLYVVNSGSNNVQVFDATAYTLKGTIALGAGHNPMNIAILSDTKAYVACSQSNKVKVVNPSTYAVTDSISVGVGATGIAIANGKVYVANTAFNGTNYTYGQGTVSVISTTTNTVVKTIDVQTNPQGCAVAPDGKVHVVCTGDYFAAFGKVVVIDPVTDAVTQTITTGGSPGNIAISTAGVGYLGTFGAGVITYTASTGAIKDSSSKPLLAGKDGSGVAFDLSGNIYIAAFGKDSVYKLNSSHAIVKGYAVGDGPSSLSTK